MIVDGNGYSQVFAVGALAFPDFIANFPFMALSCPDGPRRLRYAHNDCCADWNTFEEVDNVIIDHADAAVAD